MPAFLGEFALKRSPLARAMLACAAFGAATVLSGCNTNGPLPMSEKAARPLSDKTVAEIESKNMDKDSPILVRTFKEESELEVWKQDRTGRYALLKTYPICRWSGELGPKIKEGDRQAPEGFYNITPGQMNPNSQFYLSFDLGYPNAYDRSHGRTGANLMVHGDCSSRGCYSMTDEQISEIYALGRDSFFGGQKSFQVQAYPFRMTPKNLAKHRGNPHMAFWKMLKRGNDHFEVTKLEPKVDVCEKRYVFDAQAPGDPMRPLTFRASDKCPVFEVDADIANAVQEKQRQDEIQTAELIRRGSPTAPIKTNADGGMHPVFVQAVKRNQVGVAPIAFSLASQPPGTIPTTVRPPRIPELADAAVVTGAAVQVPGQERHSPDNSAGTRMAVADPGSQEARPAGKSGLFGGLFSSRSDDAATRNAAATKDDGAIDRMARLMRLRDKEPAPPAPQAVSAPKPKPAVRPTADAPGAIRPKPAEPPARTAPENPRPVQVASPAAAPMPSVAAAQPPAQPAAGGFNGAAPVVPAGTFDSRWSGFR
jgi:murein L,D-transpeptidase YafK